MYKQQHAQQFFKKWDFLFLGTHSINTFCNDKIRYKDIHLIDTVDRRYNAVTYNTTLKNTAMQRPRLNTGQPLNPQETPYNSPFRASFGVSFASILEKMWSRYNGTALYIEWTHQYIIIKHLQLQ